MKRWFNRASGSFHVPIRRVLIVPFVVQLCATAGIIGYLSFRTGQKAVQDITSQLRTEVSARIQRELQSYFEIPHEINRLNSAALLEGYIDTDTGQWGEAQLYQQMRISPNIAFVYCANSDGEFFGVLRSPDDGSLQLSYSNIETRRKRQFYSLNVLGQRRFSLRELDKDYDARERPWYRAAKRAEQPVWTDIYLAFTTELPNITASSPVYQRQGRRLYGVCGTDVVLPEEFRDFLAALDIGDSGQAFVVNRQGQLISSSVDEPLTVEREDTLELLPAVDSQNPLVRGTAQYITNRFGGFNAAVRTQITFQLEGQRQFLQVLPFNDGKGLDWLIVVTVPEADFMGQIYANTLNTVALALLALAGAMTVGFLITRWITRPISHLTQAAEIIAQGTLEPQIEENGPIAELHSLAMSFNSMVRQLKAAFTGLEDKVAERTASLAAAKDQVTRLNQRLKSENLRMEAELNAAKRIQEMILPKPQELAQVDSLEIAGYMEPAAEVGGDYYDVLIHPSGVVTIGIGDVTGHGLESGMLMLMTQTIVRTLLQSGQDQDPVRFLDILNRTLYANIQRMNTDKNLSLAILNYADGKVNISGQHEEILIVRADGSLERIDTMDLGLPIGLDQDIAKFIASTTLELEPGDGMVLYTDGIPEAYGEQKQQYGLPRLCQVICDRWQESAEAISQAVLADVKQFIGSQKIFDDITLLVIKQR